MSSVRRKPAKALLCLVLAVLTVMAMMPMSSYAGIRIPDKQNVTVNFTDQIGSLDNHLQTQLPVDPDDSTLVASGQQPVSGYIMGSINVVKLLSGAYNQYSNVLKKDSRIKNIVMFGKDKSYPSVHYDVTVPSGVNVKADYVKENADCIGGVETEKITDNTLRITFKLGNWNDYGGFFDLYKSDCQKQVAPTIDYKISYSGNATGGVKIDSKEAQITGTGGGSLYYYGKRILYKGSKTADITIQSFNLSLTNTTPASSMVRASKRSANYLIKRSDDTANNGESADAAGDNEESTDLTISANDDNGFGSFPCDMVVSENNGKAVTKDATETEDYQEAVSDDVLTIGTKIDITRLKEYWNSLADSYNGKATTMSFSPVSGEFITTAVLPEGINFDQKNIDKIMLTGGGSAYRINSSDIKYNKDKRELIIPVTINSDTLGKSGLTYAGIWDILKTADRVLTVSYPVTAQAESEKTATIKENISGKFCFSNGGEGTVTQLIDMHQSVNGETYGPALWLGNTESALLDNMKDNSKVKQNEGESDADYIKRAYQSIINDPEFKDEDVTFYYGQPGILGEGTDFALKSQGGATTDPQLTVKIKAKPSTPDTPYVPSTPTEPQQPQKHEVTIHEDNPTTDKPETTTKITVDDQGKVEKPAQDPVRPGYTFDGWYSDPECTIPFDFSKPVTGDLHIYAKWNKNVKPQTAKKVTGILLPKAIANGNSRQTVTWTPLTNVDGYYVYEANCNTPKKTYHFKKVADVKASAPRVYKQSGLKKGVAYKYYVVAYQIKNGKKKVVKKSLSVHSIAGNIMRKRVNYTNVKKVSVNKNAVTLKVGKTYRIQPAVKGVFSNCAILQKGHAAMFRYVYIKDGKNISVSGNGVVKAKKAGKCNVYVLGTNGVRARVAVTVK